MKNTPYTKKGNTIPDRDILNNLLQELKLTVAMLAETIGVNVGNLYQITAGRNGISNKLAHKIKDHFPEANLDYMLTGNGPITSDKIDLGNLHEETYKEISVLKIKVAQMSEDIKKILEILNNQPTS